MYMEGFKNQSITAVVRPGDRSKKENAPLTYLPEGIDLPVRFLVRAGNQEGGIPPQLFPDDGTTIRVIGHIVKPVRELTAEDLSGTAPDTATPELVRYHLATIYDMPLLSQNDIVTIWRFEYRSNALEN